MYYNNNNHSSSFRSSQQHATYIDRNNKTLRIQKHLGSGVFGNVYKAYETNTGNEYAIKMTKYNNIEPEKGINEIQILKYLQHYNDIDQKNKEHGNNNNNNNNNIIKFINSFIYRVKNNDHESTNNDKKDKVHNEFLSYRCIVMDYVGPFTLRDALNKGYITDVIQYNNNNNNNINRTNCDDRYTIKQVMKDILSAVTFMHSLNITHRDIKPENIICQISSNRIVRVVLADFGCGKMLTYNSNENHILLSTTSNNNNNNNQLVTSSSLLRTNMVINGHDDDHSVNKNIDENIHKQYPKSNPVVCTRLYRSPELLLGSSYCVLASDMFSIGIMFGEMMLGHDKYLITSTTFEEHLLKMFLLFNHLPSKQDLIDMHLDAPAIAFSNDNDDKEEETDETKFDSNNNFISSYTEYLYEELNYSFSQYFDHTNNTFIVNNNNNKKKDSIDDVNTDSDYRNQSNVMNVDGNNRIHVNVPSWYIDVPFIYHADEMNAMELLQHLLLYSPIQRMKGADALKHSFLCG